MTLSDFGQRPDKAIGFRKQVGHLFKPAVRLGLRGPEQFDRLHQGFVPLCQLFQPFIDVHKPILTPRNRDA
jgi:hypothetical protein